MRAAPTRTKEELRRSILDEPPSPGSSVSMYPRILIQVMLPYRDPGTPTWRHRNGDVSIRIETGYREDEEGEDVPCGIPYGGLGRLLLNRITTLACKQGSPVINLGATMRELLYSMDVHASGGRNGRIRYVKDMLDRIFRARVTFITREDVNEGPARKEEQVRIVREYRLWGEADVPAGSFEGQATLSPEFFEEVIRHAVPVDERMLAYFQRSPLSMDLYTWLTYRANSTWRTGKAVWVSWEQLWTQFPTEYGCHHEFARAAKKSLRQIQEVWRSLNVETPRGRLVLHPCRPHVPPR